MSIDFLIIGQGISGTWLSYYLDREGKSFLVIDNNDPLAPSRISAGIINPVTGRRHAEVWLADEVIPFSVQAYQALGETLGIHAVSQRDIIDFFPSAQMRLSFRQRVEEKGRFVTLGEEEGIFRDRFSYDFGYGRIGPAYTVPLETLLPAWRAELDRKGLLLNESFEPGQLQFSGDHLRYKDIRAGMIIYCDGNHSLQNPFFRSLPFAPNKGELLTLTIPGLDPGFIYKKGMMLVPLAGADHWWAGSDYAWEFPHGNPTEEFRERTEKLLKRWLKIPFGVTGHYAGIRPATLERRPFAGVHPHHPAVAILNGMGTKGCSLAPYFAYQLTRQLLHGEPLHPEADIRRFTRLLGKA